jgi:hypothetical protein
MMRLGQQPGNYQAIAAIVAFAAKNGKRPAFIVVLDQPFIAGCGGTFHQVKGRNGFMAYGVFVPCLNLFGSKNLHPEI